MKINNFVYGIAVMFVKVNILIVTLYIIGTKALPGEVYTFTLGFLGLVWIIVPLSNSFEQKKKENTK